jgi:hypothetical protein
MKRYMGAALALAALCGCASFHSATYYPEGKYKPTNAAMVQIYRNEPPRQFEVIGEAYLSSSYVWKQEERNLKRQIAAMGGDAAICHTDRKCSEVFIMPPAAGSESGKLSDAAPRRGETRTSATDRTSPRVKRTCAEFTECSIIKFNAERR